MITQRIPQPAELRVGADNLRKDLAKDSLAALLKSWPSEEFSDLLAEAEANPDAKWEKAEAFFIALGQSKRIEFKLRVWMHTL